MKHKPLLLPLGDHNGLGPELVVRLLGRGDPQGVDRPLLLIGPVQPLEHHCCNLGLAPFWQSLTDLEPISALEPQIYLYTPKQLKDLEMRPGSAQVQGGLAAGISLDTACSIIGQDQARGMVTCPLNKAMIKEAGFDFPGHTEFLAQRFGLGPDAVCMHLAGSRLRVSLATTHHPLARVPELICRKKILHCLQLTWKLMQDLHLSEKPIGVCGLNPHAGEQGTIGSEEREVIAPAIQRANELGIYVQGPFPADTLFYRALQQEFSSVLAMYHDQGLAPLKLLHFHQAVNITLGLPFVRTSVDHGTGYDLVNTGRAETTSLEQALATARKLVDNC